MKAVAAISSVFSCDDPLVVVQKLSFHLRIAAAEAFLGGSDGQPRVTFDSLNDLRFPYAEERVKCTLNADSVGKVHSPRSRISQTSAKRSAIC
jgi:hypothetical protein